MYWSLENVPWTNLHDLNLDWIVNTMKQTVEQWIAYRIEMNGKFADFTAEINSDFDAFTAQINEWKNDVNSDFADLQQYVQDYFDNLDLNESTRYVINQMIASGEFVEVLSPSIASEVATWLQENITPTTPAVDASLTVSGAAADAKVTGDRTINLSNELFTGRTGELKYALIPNEYVNANGVHTYQGWSRTPKLLVKDIAYININTPTAIPSTGSNYNIWYNKNDGVIGGFTALSQGNNLFEVPTNAYYLILSQETAKISNFTVTCGLRPILNDTNIYDVVNDAISLTGINNGQIVKIPYTALTHVDLANEGVGAKYRLATPIFKLKDGTSNPLNITMTNPAYSMKICCFYKDGDNYILDWDSSWTKHRRVGAYQKTISGDVKAIDYMAVVFGDAVTNRTLTIVDQMNISAAFNAFEEPSPGKYYRIATFNLARRWGVFSSKSSDEYSEWQIARYKNIFGEINPDVLCMQEALGVTELYIDTAKNFNFASNVLTFKFAFNSYYSDTRLSTKYIFDNYTNTLYTTQREGSYKQFTKCHVNIDGYSVCLFNTHTEYHGEYEEYLKPQMEELIAAMKAAMDNHECDYVIACGDFNAWHTSDFDIFVENGFKIANCGTFGDKVTWPWIDYSDPYDLVPNPDDPTGPKIPKVWNMSCLDNIIVSSNINIQNVGMVELYEASTDLGHNWPLWKDNKPYAISDHFPLYADISFT